MKIFTIIGSSVVLWFTFLIFKDDLKKGFTSPLPFFAVSLIFAFLSVFTSVLPFVNPKEYIVYLTAGIIFIFFSSTYLIFGHLAHKRELKTRIRSIVEEQIR